MTVFREAVRMAAPLGQWRIEPDSRRPGPADPHTLRLTAKFTIGNEYAGPVSSRAELSPSGGPWSRCALLMDLSLGDEYCIWARVLMAWARACVECGCGPHRASGLAHLLPPLVRRRCPVLRSGESAA